MLLGVGIPTCREGLAYPIGFTDPEFISRLALTAESVGYDSLWANDHLVTPAVLVDRLEQAPNFFEPMITFAFLATIVAGPQFVLASIVAPLRHPLLLAKQVATLDQLSHGRVILGLGSGAYREEFDLIHGEPRGSNRGQMVEEAVMVLRAVFRERRSSFSGVHYQFEDIEMYPHPAQASFPIYLSGNAPAVIRRCARLADGWIVTDVSPAELAKLKKGLVRSAGEMGRDASEIRVCLQTWVALASTREAAGQLLRDSQHFRRICDLIPGTRPEELESSFAETNLIGSIADVGERLDSYREAGVDHVGLVCLARSQEELLASVERLGTELLPSFQARSAEVGT